MLKDTRAISQYQKKDSSSSLVDAIMDLLAVNDDVSDMCDGGGLSWDGLVKLIQDEVPDNLKAYKTKLSEIIRQHKGDLIYQKLIEYSVITVKNILSKYQTARNELKAQNKIDPIQTRITKFISGESGHIISIGHPLFNDAIANPAKYGFNYFVYRWDWKGFEITIKYRGEVQSLGDLPYIGYTMNYKTRPIGAIQDALENYARGRLSRLHERAIIKSIKAEIEQIIRKINSIDKGADLDPKISNIDSVYYWLESHKGDWRAIKVLDFILSDVILNYFDICVFEAHDTKKSALDSEAYLTLNLQHELGGKPVSGTIWPLGLNMRKGGGKSRGDVSEVFDILDVIALASLGLREVTIADVLTQVLGVHISSQAVSHKIIGTEFTSFKELQEHALKPVINSLIKKALKIEQGDLIIKEMHKLFDFQETYFYNRIREWFGVDFLTLNVLQRAHADWDTINHVSRQQLKIFRGYSPNQVKTWFIQADIRPSFIQDKLGIAKTQFKRIVKNLISPFFTGQKMNSLELTRFLRKEVCIELLKDGVAPEVILNYYFHFQVTRVGKDGILYVVKSKVRREINKIFEGSGMTFKDIIAKFSSNRDDILSYYNAYVSLKYSG